MKRFLLRVLAGVGIGLLAGAAFFGTSLLVRVPENCDSINAVVDYVDSLVQRTTASAGQPSPQVSDPEVQKLIDRGRKENLEFKRFAAEQSKKARCHG